MMFFKTKIVNRLEVDGMFLNLIKAIYENPKGNVTDDSTRLNAFPQDQDQDMGVCSQCFYST